MVLITSNGCFKAITCKTMNTWRTAHRVFLVQDTSRYAFSSSFLIHGWALGTNRLLWRHKGLPLLHVKRIVLFICVSCDLSDRCGIGKEVIYPPSKRHRVGRVTGDCPPGRIWTLARRQGLVDRRRGWPARGASRARRPSARLRRRPP